VEALGMDDLPGKRVEQALKKRFPVWDRFAPNPAINMSG